MTPEIMDEYEIAVEKRRAARDALLASFTHSELAAIRSQALEAAVRTCGQSSVYTVKRASDSFENYLIGWVE
jgi:hypothetical protein